MEEQQQAKKKMYSHHLHPLITYFIIIIAFPYPLHLLFLDV